jgi:hypothetical protein
MPPGASRRKMEILPPAASPPSPPPDWSPDWGRGGPKLFDSAGAKVIFGGADHAVEAAN